MCKALAEAAAKVMGWKMVTYHPQVHPVWQLPSGGYVGEAWSPATDPAADWECLLWARENLLGAAWEDFVTYELHMAHPGIASNGDQSADVLLTWAKIGNHARALVLAKGGAS